MLTITIGSDHAGFRLKNLIISRFKSANFNDAGAYSEESCDYPDYALPVGRAVISGEADFGVLICGTGIGMSIAANKMQGIRAALCFNEFMAEKSRQHNDANVLILGARVIDDDSALNILEKWLAAPFEGGRHQTRIDKISAIEDSQGK
ncbi:MAG: ribose 5-phosphate isomerase B [Leptospirales bacterium]|nr:ribose 5-phosphate isomerase B [Leptospirales bacterium]